MATVTTKLTMTSTDLLSQTLNIAVTNAITASHTTGLARAPITSTGDPIWMQLQGGEFAFIPMHGDKTLKCYAPNGTNPVVEWMVFGTDQ